MIIPDKCLRGYNTCSPLAQIESDCGTSFICCGLNDGSSRKIEQDKFTLCWKNDTIDEESHMDEFDLLDTTSVINHALSAAAHLHGNESEILKVRKEDIDG